MTDFIVAIPARHAASRLPGKPLRLLGGTPLVVHVARRALAAGAREVWVATDDTRIRDALLETGVRVAMTSERHASGSDRLAECADIAGWADDTVVVNLQGDEPFAPPAGIRAVAETLAASGAAMATLAVPVDDAATLFDPNAVKLVRAANGVGSPRLLLLSESARFPNGLANGNDVVGRYLMHHTLVGASIWVDRPIASHVGNTGAVISSEFAETDVSRGFVNGFNFNVARGGAAAATAVCASVVAGPAIQTKPPPQSRNQAAPKAASRLAATCGP